MADARKTVTIVFADVSGSTELGERLDPEALRRVMERHFAVVREALERHGGTVEKFIGDAVMAAFGMPAAHEDDALRAVRAAAEIRERLHELNQELESELGVSLAIRTGINTGEVVTGDPASGQFYATGDAVNVAARLEQVAAPGEVLLGEETFRLVRDAVHVEAVEPLRLKGKTGLVSAYRLVEVIEGAPAIARRFDTPFVGREEQTELLLRSFERSVVERAPVLVTVLGAPGIGKTRLAGEFAARVAGHAHVLRGRCLSYGEGITFWPLQEIVRTLAIRPPDVPRPEDARSVEETFWAYRKLFETLARERPLLLVVEDIHWAEPTLLDLIEHIVEWTHDVPMIFLCLARRELLDSRPGWPGERIELEPLGESDARALVQELGGALTSESQERAITVAEGNPLFLEQMLAFAAEEKRSEAQVPDTIQALLMTRLDQLEASERRLLEAAAVVGKEFWRSALLFLSPSDAEVSPLLQRLVRRRLIHPDRSSVPGEDAFRFGHILIREAAYASIPKKRRAALHERFADWLEELARPYDEITAYHLEQAYHFRCELTPGERATRELAERAALKLFAAGENAFQHGDMAATASLLSRGVELAAPNDPRRLRGLVLLGSALPVIGESERVIDVLSEAIETAQAVDDEASEWRARLELSLFKAQFHPTSSSSWNEHLLREAEVATARFQRLGDVQGLARAWRAQAQALHWMGDQAAAIPAAEQAVLFGEQAGDQYERGQGLYLLAMSLYDGAIPAPEAIERCEKLLVLAGDDRIVVAGIERKLAMLYAMQGRQAEARRCVNHAVEVYQDMGMRYGLAIVLGFEKAGVDRGDGDLIAAEADVRQALSLLAQMDEKGTFSTLAARLAELLAEQERDEEAERFLALAEETGAADDWVTQAWTKSTRAVLLARRQEFEAAIGESRDALALVDATDDIEGRGWHRFDLAKILVTANRPDEAGRFLNEAIQLFEEKGQLRGIDEARALLVELEGSATPG